MRTTSKFILATLLIAASGNAIAQAPPSPATPPQATAPPPPQRASDCTPSQTDRSRGTVMPNGATTGQAREPLGDKLAQSDGVLCPPAGIDPEMRAPAPDVGKTPVIPPPGSPGGDPTIRPK
ncbi:hypothetical protein NLM33_20655 [Bradyrhizobium sp. CCGUVB1N3]|uniref:hypothetical protein n=1 Tax=Bradyrhizobium sp. CCGUVB1N3 TaxID=2949629 RepID=UPI0020B1D727|nr:hypothetical protein [Bradyrhizobium sp. CCGUVB1N3]MCP3472726.1 hypothetical protein [Bradyrhizobium sp. CCGUVB1N3]